MSDRRTTQPADGPAPDVFAVGGCHRDLVGRTDGPFAPATSCPGRIRETAGGVARNVAVLLASAGLRVELASRLGVDAAGRTLLEGLARAGVETLAVGVDAAAATGTYVALHDEAGELVAAMSDLSIYDGITPQSLSPAEPRIAGARLVFADANLPAPTLAHLAARAGPRLAVDAISRAKAPRIEAAMRKGALLFANRLAAESLVGSPLEDAASAAAALRRSGARQAVVTAGPDPLAVLDGDTIITLPVRAVAVRDVTGAGDALIAGTLAALLSGTPLAAAVEGGIEAAAAALSVEGALAALPPALVQRLRAAKTE